MFVAHTIQMTGCKTPLCKITLLMGAVFFAMLGLFVPQTWAMGPDPKPDGEKLYKEHG